jgi:hypothetical protein
MHLPIQETVAAIKYKTAPSMKTSKVLYHSRKAEKNKLSVP